MVMGVGPNMLKKLFNFIVKYFPDILIQIGLFAIFTNGGLKSIFIRLDSDAVPFVSLIFIGINIAIRRVVEGKNKNDESIC